MIKWVLSLFLFLSLAVNANDETYIDVGDWQVSIALGIGVRTNPLVGGDHIPLVALPDIAYYGEAFYFDNGDLGYSLLDEPRWNLSVVTRFNAERAFFSFLHPANLLSGSETAGLDTNTDTSSGVSDPDLSGPQPRAPEIADLAARKYAVDGGLQFNYYFDGGAVVKFKWFYDISDVYNGSNGSIEYSQAFALQDWRTALAVGLGFKSKSLVDYYYGLDERDNVLTVNYYQAKATVEPFVRLSTVYPLNEHWSLLGLAKVRLLADGMTDSPVVSDDLASTFFVGASYEF